MDKNINLPMPIKENLPIKKLRKNDRLKENVKRIGKILLYTGVAISGLTLLNVGGAIAISVGSGIYMFSGLNALKNIVFKKEKGSMFVTRKSLKGEISLWQDSSNIKEARKMKGFNQYEKGALMGLQMLVGLQNYKQQYEDENVATEDAKDGEGKVYSPILKTITHGINIKTIEALEKLGYLQIEKKEEKQKSMLMIEKLGFGQYKEFKSALLAIIQQDKEKINEIRKPMYEIAFKLTDKPLNFDEIYKTYQKLLPTKGKNPIRKPIRRIGIILETLKNRNIDVTYNELGILSIQYDAPESFAKRVERINNSMSEEQKFRNNQKVKMTYEQQQEQQILPDKEKAVLYQQEEGEEVK